MANGARPADKRNIGGDHMRHGDRQRNFQFLRPDLLRVACALAVLIQPAPEARANDPAHAIADKFAAEAERARQRDGAPQPPASATADAERNAALKAAEARRAAEAKKAAEQKKKAAAKKLADAEQQRKADKADEAAMIEQVRGELDELKAEEARAIEADRMAAEQSRQAEALRAEAQAEAEAAARRAAEAALEAEARRRVLVEREAREREAEARRVAEAEADQRRQAEQIAAAAKAAEQDAAKTREIETARLAEEQRQAAAMREEESRRLAERLARQREARLPPPDTRPLEPAPAPATRPADPKPADVARQRVEPPAVDLAPPNTAALVTRDPARDTASAAGGRATVLLSMRPGDRGIRRFEKSADPVLCVGAVCYISMGAGQDARPMSRNAALGTVNTLGGRAGACNRSLTCVFRNVDLGDLTARLQPVDLKVMRHDRRAESDARADATCMLKDSKLECRATVIASDYRLWVVPEEIARKAGADELAIAVVARLQERD